MKHQILFLQCVLAVSVLAVFVSTAPATTVLAGDDFLSTVPGDGSGGGTFFDFGGPIGLVQLEGNPNPGAPFDTVVRRLEDADIGGPGEGGPPAATIQIELVALSLKSVAPVTIGGGQYDLFIDLSPTSPSVGQMVIRHEWNDHAGPLVPTFQGPMPAGGTFDSFFPVFADLRLEPIGPVMPLPVQPIQIPLQSQNTHWAHGTGGGFLIECPILEVHPGGAGVHEAEQVIIPEPLTMLGVLAGVGGLAGYIRKRRV